MEDNRRVVITGMGVICATGSTVAQFLDALQEGRARHLDAIANLRNGASHLVKNIQEDNITLP